MDVDQPSDNEQYGPAETASSANIEESDGIESKFVVIHPIHKRTQETHIVNLLESAQLCPRNVHTAIHIEQSNSKTIKPNAIPFKNGGSGSKWICRIQFDSVANAKTFIAKYNGSTLESRAGSMRSRQCPVSIQMVDHDPSPWLKEVQSSCYIKITNLNPQISQKRLKMHIRQSGQSIPENITIYRAMKKKNSKNSKGITTKKLAFIPAFAIVQMASSEAAQKMLTLHQMSTLMEYQMWLGPVRPPQIQRNAHLKGCPYSKSIALCNLPHDIQMQEIRLLCSPYIAYGRNSPLDIVKKKDMQLMIDNRGYFLRKCMVRFPSANEAAAAFDGLHGQELRGNALETQYIARFSGTNCLSIEGIPQSVNKVDICKFVLKAMDVPCVRPLHIRLKPALKPKRALVTFANPEQVIQCISKLKGGQMSVRAFAPARVEYVNTSTRVRIENVPPSVTEKIIANHFHRCTKKQLNTLQQPVVISLFHHPSDANVMGFAFMDFMSHQDAQLAVDKMSMTEVEGQEIYVEFNASKTVFDRREAERGHTKQVILRGVHYSAKEKDIRAICAKYGKVESIKLKYTEKGFFNGTCSVQMDSTKNAARVFDRLNGRKSGNLKMMTSFYRKKEPTGRVLKGQGNVKVNLKEVSILKTISSLDLSSVEKKLSGAKKLKSKKSGKALYNQRKRQRRKAQKAMRKNQK